MEVVKLVGVVELVIVFELKTPLLVRYEIKSWQGTLDVILIMCVCGLQVAELVVKSQVLEIISSVFWNGFR